MCVCITNSQENIQQLCCSVATSTSLPLKNNKNDENIIAIYVIKFWINIPDCATQLYMYVHKIAI